MQIYYIMKFLRLQIRIVYYTGIISIRCIPRTGDRRQSLGTMKPLEMRQTFLATASGARNCPHIRLHYGSRSKRKDQKMT